MFTQSTCSTFPYCRLVVACLDIEQKSEDVETLKTCPGREGIRRGCPPSCQLFVLLAEKMDMFLLLVLKLIAGIEIGHCVFKVVE